MAAEFSRAASRIASEGYRPGRGLAGPPHLWDVFTTADATPSVVSQFRLPDRVVLPLPSDLRSVSPCCPETAPTERVGGSGPVTVDHLDRVASLAADLDDPDVMSGAWS